MNKRSFHIASALVASCAFSGSALAETNASSVAALTALPAVDTTWVIANEWKSIDSSKTTAHSTVWDNPIDGLSDPCGDSWAGIYCNADNDITHIEIPNAKMNGTLTAVLTALEPIKANLVSINLSSTTAADKNVLTGGIPANGTTGALEDYDALRYLGLNFIGASGDIPDLSSNAALVVANFYGNSFTSYTGPVGGEALNFLGLHENPGMTGDLADTMSNSPNLTSLSSYGTALTGGLNGVENIMIGKGTGDGEVTVSWSVPSSGARPDAYSVALSSDGGTTWVVQPDDVTTTTTTVSGLADGTYFARVTPKTSSGLVGSVQAVSAASVTLDSSGSGGSGSTGGGTDSGSGTTGGTGSSGGGGAAFWLLGLPLFGFVRRSR